MTEGVELSQLAYHPSLRNVRLGHWARPKRTTERRKRRHRTYKQHTHSVWHVVSRLARPNDAPKWRGMGSACEWNKVGSGGVWVLGAKTSSHSRSRADAHR